MKTAIILIAALCVVTNTEALELPKPPTRLPIGSDNILRESAVTSGVQSVTTTIYYTNKVGTVSSCFTGTGNHPFASFEDYKAYTISNAYRIFNQFKFDMDQNKIIRWRSVVAFVDQSGINIFYSLICDKRVEIVSQVTSNTFVNSLDPTNVHTVVSVPGLQEFTVEVKGVYSNYWSSTPASKGPTIKLDIPRPPELTTDNIVVLNPWYSTGTNNSEVRISIKVGGKREWYTQFGNSLSTPPNIGIRSSYLDCSFPKGAIAEVQSSTNLVDWSILTTHSDMGGIGTFSVSNNRNQPCEFYRVGIR